MSKNSVVLKAKSTYFDVEWHVMDAFDARANLTAVELSKAIRASLQSLFGMSAAATAVDVLSFDADRSRALIRCLESDAVQVWNALTFVSCVAEQDCVLRVTRHSAWLPRLSVDDRAWQSEIS